MSKIKVTVYDRQTDSEEYRYAAHTISLCGFGCSRQEAISNLLMQINRHFPRGFNFSDFDLEVQHGNYLGNLLWGRSV